MSIKIVTVVGARPQFVKAAALSRKVRESHVFDEVLVHTGQHYDDNMSKVFFKELELPAPNYHLKIGKELSHGEQTGLMLQKIEQVLLAEKPKLVLVYGDTNSTLAGALAAAKLHIPVAHVEAGLRSFNREMPEEINRVLTDHIADLLFVPTVVAEQNLCHEGIVQGIHFVGDIMYDVALYYGEKAERNSHILEALELEQNNYALATVHRPSNTGNAQRLRRIIEGLIGLTKDMPIVLPIHPRTRLALKKIGLLDQAIQFIKIVEPLGYLDMVMLEKHARIIVTDSGGVQKEAYFHKVPCVTLRDETEWIELVENGWNHLIPIGYPKTDVCAEIKKYIGTVGKAVDLYGLGNTADLIVEILIHKYCN